LISKARIIQKPLIAAKAQAKKRPTAVSWRMDETYIKVKGKWTYYYRAIDKFGKTFDFMPYKACAGPQCGISLRYYNGV
jgi:transposase-like protein